MHCIVGAGHIFKTTDADQESKRSKRRPMSLLISSLSASSLRADGDFKPLKIWSRQTPERSAFLCIAMRWTSASSLLLLCCSVFALSVYFFHKQLDGSIWQDALEQVPDSLVALQQCPSPYYTPINTKAAARPDLPGPNCVQLNLDKKTRFSAQICETRSTATCNALEVVIKRKKCDQLNDMRLSSSAQEEQYIREELGSDTFHIAITGPELYATVTPTKYSQCEYRYEIRLSNPGGKPLLAHVCID